MAIQATSLIRQQHEGEQEDRRTTARRVVAGLRSRVDIICRNVDRAGIADEIREVVDEVRTLVNDPQLGNLLPRNLRGELLEAADRYEGIQDNLDGFESACRRLRNALETAERVLSAGAPSGALAVAGILAVAVILALVAGFVLAQFF